MLDRFSKRSKAIGLILAGCLAALLLVVVRPSVMAPDRWADGVSWGINRFWAEPRGFRIALGQVTGTPLTQLTLVDVRVEGAGPLVSAHADTLRLKASLLGLLKRKIQLQSLVLVSPDVVLTGPASSGKHVLGGEGSSGLEIEDFLIRRGCIRGSLFGAERKVSELRVAGFFRVGEGGFALRLDHAAATLAPPDLEIRSLTGWLTGQGSHLRPQLALEIPGLSVTVRGEASLDPGVSSDLKIGVEDLALERIRTFTPSVPDWADGWISGALYFTGSPTAWETRVSLQGEVAGGPPAMVRGKVAVSGESVAIPELILEIGGARLVGRDFRVALDACRFDGNVEVRALDLRRVVPDVDTETDLNASGQVTGWGLGGFPDSIRMDLDLESSRAGRWSLTGGRIGGMLGRDRFDVSDLAVNGPGWRCVGTGAWRRDETMRAGISCDFTSLEDVGRCLQVDLGGRGALHVEMGGRPGDIQGRAAVDLEGLKVGPAAMDTLFANLVFGRRDGPLEVSGLAGGQNLHLGSVMARKAAVSFKALGRELEEFQAMSQIDSVLLQMEGRMTDRSGVRTVSFSRAEISSPSQLWKNAGRVDLILSRGYELKPSRWECAGGSIEAQATVLPEGALDLVLRGEAVDLRALSEVFLSGRSLGGTLDLDTRVTGSLEEPRVQTVVGVYPLVVGPVTVDSVIGSLDLGSGRLGVDSLQIIVAGGRGDLRGFLPVDFALGGDGGSRFEIRGPGDVGLKVSGIPLETFGAGTPEAAPFGGYLDLVAAFSGRPENPEGEIQATVEGARFQSFDLGRVDLRGGVRNRTWVIDEIGIASGQATGRIAGTIPLETTRTFPWMGFGSADASLRIEVENGRLTFLPVLKRSVFQMSDGRYDLDLSISGSLGDPLMDGRLNVREGMLRLGPLAEEVTSMEAGVTLAGHQIRIDRLTGALGGGALTARGRVTLDSLRATDFLVRASAKRSEIWSLLDDVIGVVDVDLAVGPDTTDFGNVVPNYSGRVEVHQAEITRELPRSGKREAPTAFPTWTAELAIEAGNNVWVRNSDAEIELEGSVLFKKSSRGMTFLGDVQTIRGRYFLYNHEFRITEGTLEFADVTDIRNARMEVRAETEVATEEGRERVTLDITGTIAKPYLAATSESGYSEPEIFRLLALGDEAGAEDQGTATPFSRALARSWGRILARKFGSELARSLGLDEVEIEPGPGDPGAREFVEGARVGVGKYLSDRLYLKYKQSLAVNPLKGDSSGGSGGAVTRSEAELPDRQLLLEYRLSRSFSLDGEASVVNGKSYFNFDVKFRHRY